MLYWVSPGCPFLCSLGWLDKTRRAKRAKAERGSRDEEGEIKQTGFFLLVARKKGEAASSFTSICWLGFQEASLSQIKQRKLG